MPHCQELYELLRQTVLPEIESVMTQMETYASQHDISDEMAQDQAGIKAMFENFSNIVAAIEAREIEAANCESLLSELNMMRQMGTEAEH
ncbi:MAG: hypothetical protein DSZ03_07895 [Sulfurimonas sp.]|nr:MAG: hypothetical protein DSZ03_07895 [Sulfurimonas sp.]